MIVNESTLAFVEQNYEGEEEIIKTVQDLLKEKVDDVIVECAYNKNLQPFPFKIREDKTAIYKDTKSIFGNGFYVALSNFNNILDPITKEYLENPT